MVKIRVTDRGIIQEQGSGFEGSPTSVSSTTRTASATLSNTDAGVTILSSSQGVLTLTMPEVSSAIGGMFIVRSTSPSAHVLTCSQNAGNRFVTRIGQSSPNATGSQGDSITFPATAGTSIAMLSDGSHWLVLGGSGSMVFAAGAVGSV